MTKEEAIEILSRPKSMKNVPAEILTAHNMAIQALEQDSWEDAIKYFDAIYELSQTLGVSYNFIDEKIKEIVTALKASPPEKVGYWFIDERPESNREIICSNCEQPIFKYRKIDFDYRPSFCPNCGAKMREIEE